MKPVWVFAAWLGLTVQPAQTTTIEQLRARIAADAGAAPGQQFIHFGPMKDGHTLSVTTTIENNSSAVGIEPAGHDVFVIHLGRTLVLKSIPVLDAMMICTRLPQVACGRMAGYIERVKESSSPTETPFLEEVYPDLREAAQSSRTDDAAYSVSLLAGIQSLTGLAILHEIGHAALHHLDHQVSEAAQIGQEGEADGFAAYIAEAANALPGGVAVAFLFDAASESLGGTVTVLHPPGICRATVMISASIDWLRRQETEIRTPGDNRARDVLAKKMFDQVSSPDVLAALDTSGIQNCKQYIYSFATGFERARTLVNKNTSIDSAVPNQK